MTHLRKSKKSFFKKIAKILIVVVGFVIGIAIILIAIVFSVNKEFRDIILQSININPYSFQIYPKLNKLISNAGTLTSYSLFEGKNSTDFSNNVITYKEGEKLVSLLGLDYEILYDNPKLQGKYVVMVTNQLEKQQFIHNEKLDSTYKNDWEEGKLKTYDKNNLICQMNISNTHYWKDCPNCSEYTGEPADTTSPNLWHYYKLSVTCGKVMDSVLKQDYDSFYSLLYKDYKCQDMIIYVELNNQKFARGQAGCVGNVFGGESWLSGKRNGKWQIILTVNSDAEPPICKNIFQEYKVPSEFTKNFPCSENF